MNHRRKARFRRFLRSRLIRLEKRRRSRPAGVAGPATHAVAAISIGALGLFLLAIAALVVSDISYKYLTEAVISDADGEVVLNLAQQDAVAMRAVMRVAFQVANPISLQNPTEGTRFPFAVLAPAAP